MSASLIQHKIDTTGGGATPYTLAFTGNMTAGNLVVGFICTGLSSPTPTVTDPGTGDTYSVTATGNNTVDLQYLFGFYKVGVAGGQTTVQVVQAGGSAMGACLMEFSSTTGWSGFRNASSGGSTTSGATSTCSGAVGAAGDVIVAGLYKDQDALPSTADGALTLLDTASIAAAGGVSADSYVLSALGAVTASYHNGGTDGWTIGSMAFTPVAPTGTTTYNWNLGVNI